MKTFSLGFILIFSIIALVLHIELKSIKEFFESLIVVLPSLVVLAFFTWLVITTIGNRFIHFTIYSVKKVFAFCKYVKDKLFSKTNGEQNKTKELNWQCLLIDGTWGSGKTTHYEKHYQYIDDKPNIYISCFSASRSELIAQIIQQQFWCKLLTLNGLLAKLMENNWQIFMPSNRVVVFDDLERLHANQENYLDLIGIIDYLKDKKKCKIILICSMSELKEYEKHKQHIFNTYMERIVDDVEFVSKLSDLSELFKTPKNNQINVNLPIIKKVIHCCQRLYNGNQLNNLRIFKTAISDFTNKLNIEYQESKDWDNQRQIIYAETYVEELRKSISIRYLFYMDYSFFYEVIEYIKNKDPFAGLFDKSIKEERVKDESKEKELEIERKLKKTSLGLKIDDFKSTIGVKNISELLSIKFEEYKIIHFLFLDFANVAKYFLDDKLNIFVLQKTLSDKYSTRSEHQNNLATVWVDTQEKDINSLIISTQNQLQKSRVELKNIMNTMKNYDIEINILDALRNYILTSDNFVMPLLQDVKKWLPNYATYNHNFAYYNDQHINIYFALAMLMHKFGLSKEKAYIIDEIYSAYHTQKKHIGNYNYEFSKNKLKIFMIIREKHLLWYLDSNSTLKSIIKQLNDDFKIILTEINKNLV